MPPPLRLRPLSSPIRHAVRRPSLRRQFHASAPQQSWLDTSTAVLTSLQSTSGLPWYAFIPLSAITLRFLVTAPLTVYARSYAIRYVRLQPLFAAWSRTIARATLTSTKASADPSTWLQTAKKNDKSMRASIRKRLGLQRWKMYLPIAQLPVWIVASMTLRNLAGVNALPSWMGIEVSTPGVAVQNIGLETGGLGAWTDLTSLDPTLVLPGIFIGSILLNVELQSKWVTPRTRLQKGLRRAMVGMAVVMFPLAAQVPACVTLYWATSSVFSVVQNCVLQWLAPYPAPVEPCKTKPEVPGIVLDEYKEKSVVVGGKKASRSRDERTRV